MAIARSTLTFTGTDETTGSTIANNGTDTGSELDLLGDNVSTGKLELYLVFTSTVTVGSIDVRFNPRRVTGQAYTARAWMFQVPPINGAQKLYLGTIDAPRYANVEVKNNATGASATNVSVLGLLTRFFG